MPINCFHFWHRLSAFSRTFVDLGDIFPNCWKIASATSDALRQLSTNGNEASFSKIQKQKACCCRMIDQLLTMQLLTFEKYSSLIYHVCNLNTLDWCDHTIHKTPFAELDTLHDILKITRYPQNHAISSKSLLLHQEFRRKLRKIWRMMFCKIYTSSIHRRNLILG